MHRRQPGLFLREVIALGVSLIFVSVTASPAHAQLGRLKKIAEEATRKTVEKPAEASKKAGEFGSNEDARITDERIDGVVKTRAPMQTDAWRSGCRSDRPHPKWPRSCVAWGHGAR